MSRTEQVSYDVIGNVTTGATLTAAYSGNVGKAILVKYMPNIHLDIQLVTHASSAADAYALILVEISNDDGATYFPHSTLVHGTTESDVFIEGTGSTSGIPFIVPGDKTVAVGTTYKGQFDLSLVATHVRVSAKQNAASNFGTLYVRLSAFGN